MGATKQIARDQWKSYFDAFGKRHLRGELPTSASVEVVSSELGDQTEATRTHLEGIDYDPKSDALEVALEDRDHLVFQPAEIWVVEEDDGFISALEIVHAEGSREIMRLERGGSAAQAHAAEHR